MSPADYEALGFMSGLEVHQQLITRGKLFCRCPAGRRVTPRGRRGAAPHAAHALASWASTTAARSWSSRRARRSSTCSSAARSAPTRSTTRRPSRWTTRRCASRSRSRCSFGLNLVSELHVMRKQYLDGSIPTGFQRTAMMGLAGRIPFRVPRLGVDRELRIRQFSLEEDSCREVSDVGHRITFRTDRLGMPLIETVTEPDFLTPLRGRGGRPAARAAWRARPARCAEAAGAARQDTNVSVAGGRRVEIKGVGNHRRLPLLTHNEALPPAQPAARPRRAAPPRRAGRGAGAARAGPPVGALAAGDRGGLVAAPLRVHAAARRPRPRRDGRGAGAARLRRPARAPDPAGGDLRPRVRRPRAGHRLPDGAPVHDPLRRDRLRPLAGRVADPGASGCAPARATRVIVLWGPEEDVETGVREVFVAGARGAGRACRPRRASRSPTAPPASSASCPAPTACTPTPTRRPRRCPTSGSSRPRRGSPSAPWARTSRYEALGLAGRAGGPPVGRHGAGRAPRRARPAGRRGGPARGGGAAQAAGPLAPAPRRARRGPRRSGSSRWPTRSRAASCGPRASSARSSGRWSSPSARWRSCWRPIAPGPATTAAVERLVAAARRARAVRWRSARARACCAGRMGLVMREAIGRADPREVEARLAARLGASPAEVGR